MASPQPELHRFVSEEKDFQESINQSFGGGILKGTIDYNNLLNLAGDYKVTLGQGMTIALLDTGISSRAGLKDLILPDQCDLTESSHNYEDISGHGTFLSGLICGYPRKQDTMVGIAPKCKIANIKVINDQGTATGRNLQKGLEKVKEEYLNCIINMSLNITAREYRQLMSTKIIDLLSENNVCDNPTDIEIVPLRILKLETGEEIRSLCENSILKERLI